jgi:glutamate-1-semialdehyde 2,1-aminomutase
VATLAIPGTPGIPQVVAAQTLVVPYNNVSALQRVFDEQGESIAALILEPVAGNMGVVAPAPGYLEAARRITQEQGSILIFDEVITGFRVAYGGAQERYRVRPDLTTLGKILGGGLPVGAYGGRADLMDLMAPVGKIYQAGTLSGNPLAMAAGLATLRKLKRLNPYSRLDDLSGRLAEGLASASRAAKVPLTVHRVGSLLTPFFTSSPVSDFSSASKADARRYAAFFHGMLERGVYLPPAQFEAMFLSTSHTASDIDRTVEAAGDVLARLGA